jgi:DNA-binding NarL/FixJ family response regulator
LLASKKDFNVALGLDSALASPELIRHSRPDVLLVDAVDAGFDLKDVSLLQKLVPEAKVVLFAHEFNGQFEVQAIRARVWGGVSRRSHPEVLEKALLSKGG